MRRRRADAAALCANGLNFGLKILGGINIDTVYDGKGDLCDFFESIITHLYSNEMQQNPSVEFLSVSFPAIGISRSTSQGAMKCDSKALAASICKILQDGSRLFLEMRSTTEETEVTFKSPVLIWDMRHEQAPRSQNEQAPRGQNKQAEL